MKAPFNKLSNRQSTSRVRTGLLRSACLLCLLAPLGLGGCRAFLASVDNVDPMQTGPLSARYDHRDMIAWTDEIVTAVLAHPFPPQGEAPPILVEMGIRNRTATHLDTEALADSITTKLLDSRKMRFANARDRDILLKEQGYQLANCTPETRVSIGRQLGAKYMLTGSISEDRHESGKQVRVSKRKDVFYLLTLEITDLETGILAVKKQVRRLRRESTPIIGW